MAAGDVWHSPQPGFRLRLRRPRLPQEQGAPEAMDFRFPLAFLMSLHQGMGLGQNLETVFRVAQVVTHSRQQDAPVWDVQRRPGGSVGGDLLADPGPPRPGPAWPAPIHPSSFRRPPTVASPARSRV
ncbi:MAG TPA: hypothetical protein VIH59_10565 [Candidatus Tectomicrobia bacterium]|jgi:hypothetical protein